MFCRGFSRYGYGGGGGMFIMMGFGFLIFLVLIYLSYILIKTNSPSPLSSANNSALSILNERYAKGEINEEEYTKKKSILSRKN